MPQPSFRTALSYNSFVSPLVASHDCTFRASPWVSVSQAFTLTPSPMQLSNSSAYSLRRGAHGSGSGMPYIARTTFPATVRDSELLEESVLVGPSTSQSLKFP